MICTDIAKITSPVLLISGDKDGLDKMELIKTYRLLGGGPGWLFKVKTPSNRGIFMVPGTGIVTC
jgi:hypothetical protein